MHHIWINSFVLEVSAIGYICLVLHCMFGGMEGHWLERVGSNPQRGCSTFLPGYGASLCMKLAGPIQYYTISLTCKSPPVGIISHWMIFRSFRQIHLKLLHVQTR